MKIKIRIKIRMDCNKNWNDCIPQPIWFVIEIEIGIAYETGEVGIGLWEIGAFLCLLSPIRNLNENETLSNQTTRLRVTHFYFHSRAQFFSTRYAHYVHLNFAPSLLPILHFHGLSGLLQIEAKIPLSHKNNTTFTNFLPTDVCYPLHRRDMFSGHLLSS